ncbi:TRL-like family protein [Leptospira ryugenii]|uniref:TRL-like family protein n=1 Tax=Leptospira ryugenii TaxID=1917863 RepID=UPI000D5A1709|nr:TRL-like family protein [Leptospira ryugenii]
MKFFLVSLFFLFSCASPGYGPFGFLYSNSRIGIFSNGENSSLESTRCTHSILGLFAFGDASIESAKKQAQISTVTEVHWKTTQLTGLYASLCVIVSGNP